MAKHSPDCSLFKASAQRACDCGAIRAEEAIGMPGSMPHAPSCKSLGLELVTFAEAERRLLFATLDHFNGDKRAAAKSLGVSLKTIYNRIHHYGAQQA